MKRVQKVIAKTKELEPAENRPGSVLSGNKVTGWSVNFPIQGTCRPSKVCIETCYYATSMTAWSNSLRKQLWLYNACVEDPIAFAESVVKEYRKKDLDFLRWNGGGDLFPEAVTAVNHIGSHYPDVVLWVVTRKPEMAALVEGTAWNNVHLHFSLDRHSMDRRQKAIDALAEQGNDRPIFFSYQCERGEEPDVDELTAQGVSLFFFDNYRAPERYITDHADVLCPLNLNRAERNDITGSCGECRKCFDGSWL